MDKETENLIQQYICIPYAIKVTKLDIIEFQTQPFKLKRFHLARLDLAIESLQDLLNTIRGELHSKHRIHVTVGQRQGNYTTYKWRSQQQSGELTYSSTELKQITTDILMDVFTKLPIPQNLPAWI
ncbi:hypothetical protein CHH49_03985 [Terribacillus saccharophilus]|uniref:hypothetical protein n=1 Tax=Terribacillus saccharophilus TaxID=361277 RepID=UPI000BA5F00A|nr:hypothetical protein [Terribacillus saccharophilus]PAF22754.1 hypothetical protein CHH49_03985 [Terribacillus saccharophilus]